MTKNCQENGVIKDMKRFTVTPLLDIKDNRTGETYAVDVVHNHPYELCNLLNTINDRADRNAEMVDMSTINLMFELENHRLVVERLNQILNKYEIDSLEKLDLMLIEQRVW